MLYRFLPDRRLEWRHVIVGALLFSIGKQGLGVYLGQSTTRSTYGATHYERRRPPPQEFAEKDPHAVKPSSAGTSS